MSLPDHQVFACETYVLSRSWRCRRMPRRSRRLIRHCLDMMPYYTETKDEAWLHGEMMEEAGRIQPVKFTRGRLRPKNAAVLWLILKFVLPVLIRLVIEWWLSKQRSEA